MNRKLDGKHPTKGQTLPAEILSGSEVQRLIGACSQRSSIGVRNRALITLMWRSGLRVSEAIALLPKDVDPTAGTIRILHGKGNKSRTAGMDAAAFDTLLRWMERRQTLGLTGRQPLFCSLKGTAIQSAYVRSLLPRLAKKANIEKRVNPHSLRHTHASELAREGVPLNTIQKQLGHSSAATTARYLDHIAPQQVIETMRNRKWETGEPETA